MTTSPSSPGPPAANPSPDRGSRGPARYRLRSMDGTPPPEPARRAPRRRHLAVGALSGLIGLLAAGGVVTALADEDDRPTVDLRFEAGDADGSGGGGDRGLVGGDSDGALVPADQYALLGGGLGSLAQHRGTPLVVNFFGSWCLPCRTEMPAFEQVHDALGERVAFVGLAVRDSARDAQELVDSTGVSYEIGFDRTGKFVEALDILTFPTTLLVSSEGRVVSVQPGQLDARELRALIEDHLL